VSQSTLSGLVLEIKPVLKRFLTNMPQRFEVAKNHMLLHGAVIEIDDATGKTIKIQRVSEPVLSASDESWIEHQNV
jgi:calcineurin-like phosphoesterase